MTITFTGLSSGLDTDSIIDSIIEVEGASIGTMEDTQDYLESKLEVYTDFNTLLESFNTAVLQFNSENDLATFDINNTGSASFSVTTTSISEEGSYSVEVVSLAQTQKDVTSEGFADSDTTTLGGTLQFGETTLEYEDVTLADLAEMINDGGYGVSATVVDTGEENGNHLMITADTAGEEIEITGSGDITMDTGTNGHTVTATRAQVTIDGVDYYSNNNTITSAIKGTTITLLGTSDSGSDTLTFSSSAQETASTALDEIVSAYNEINDYISSIYEEDPTLANSMKLVQRNLKNYLTSDALVNLGVGTNWETGELEVDEDVFAAAWEEDSESIIDALVGENGVMVSLDDYINQQVNSSTGFLAVKESSIDEKISDLDDRIEAMETRLEKRRETLEDQFTAMETLLSTLDSQSDYLTSFFENYNSD